MRAERRRCGQKGFSLIEVLVAAAVVSLGLGGMSLLLLLAVHGTLAPRSATLAALHARSLTDALRLVPDGIVAESAEPGDCADASCPPAAMAASIMESWHDRIERDLPTGRGLVCRDSTLPDAGCSETPVGAVRVTWRTTDPETGAEATRALELALPLP
jgi:type IV pilus assembly protein PilV